MLIYNNKLYTISDDIEYKQRKGKSDELGYVIYHGNKTYRIDGLAAILFDRLLRFNTFGLFDEVGSLVNHTDSKINNKHMLNMFFLNFLNSKWLKEYKEIERFELEASDYTYCTAINNKHYLINFLYNTVDLVSPQTFEQFINKKLEDINYEELFYLYSRRHLKISSRKEDECFALNVNPESLVYIIFSYACNLKCIYCFEKDINRSFQIDEHTLENAMSYIDRLSKKGRVMLTFYGGEPLLEMNSAKLKKVIERFIDNNNIRYRFITNGVNAHKFLNIFSLIKDRIDKFVITVDGTREVHDKRRISDESQGTFDVIFNNISMLSEHGYPVSIRLNVDYSNYKNQEELLCFMNDRLKNTDDVAIEYHRIENKNNQDFVPVTYLDCYKLYHMAKRISKFNIKFSVPLLIALENIKEQNEGFADLCNTCCSMNRNHVIDLDGMVYSCNEAMGIEDFRYASVRDELAVAPKKTKKSYCSCPFFFACFCNCSLKKYYDSLENENMKCEYSQIEELVHYFLESTY